MGIQRECHEETGCMPQLAVPTLPSCTRNELWLFYRGLMRNPLISLSSEHDTYAWIKLDELPDYNFRNPAMPDAIRTLALLMLRNHDV